MSIETIEMSVFMAVCHLILEMILINLESKATNTSMGNYSIVCFNAREGWLPFASRFKTRNEHIESSEEGGTVSENN